ncbi:hypothetical protein GGF46_000906 [Coemansia sp. RSA 552]|nr:hypothetical protein GGF46_000906 [Coemansia sp. RSA 552]
MTRSLEPGRKRQRVGQRERQRAAPSGPTQMMVTRLRSRSMAGQQSRAEEPTSVPEVSSPESCDGEDAYGSSQGGVVLTSRLICALEPEQELVAKLEAAFSDPCTLARSFPQADSEQAAECPIDAADVRAAYAHIFAKGSEKVVGDMRMLTINAVAMLGAEPCDEHDNHTSAVLILLLNPRITEYAHDDGTYLFPELCSVILGQLPSQRAALMRYFEADGARRASFERYVGIFQAYLTRAMGKAVQTEAASGEAGPHKVSLHALGSNNNSSGSSSALPVVAQCMALMNSHNDSHAIAPYTVFYNKAVNEHIDIKDDVPRFRIPDGVSFCSYPFLLSPTTKSEIIRIESVILMRTELQDSFFRAMFSGVTCPYLVLEVRRDSLVRDTLYQLDLKLSQDLRKQLKVRFVGEEGVDEGGVQKEFFQLIVRDVFSPKYGIFRAGEDSHCQWFLPQAEPSPDALEEIRLTGQLIGLAVYNAVILDIHLPPALYKKLLGLPVTRDDLHEVDPALHHGLMQLLRLSSAELEFLERTFEVEYEDLGEIRTRELVPGGAHTQLTADNRQLFIDKYVDFVFNVSCERQFAEFKRGFDRICGASYVRFMRPQELELLVCGCSDLDFAALEQSTIYDGGYTKSTPVIQHFWEVVSGFSDELKRKLLFFATSSDRVPIGGLSKLHFVIAKNGGDSDRLPTSHTCFNVLLLPEYSSMGKLRERLLTAIHNSEGFGMI